MAMRASTSCHPGPPSGSLGSTMTDMTWRWSRMAKDKHGDLDRFISTAADITVHRKAEEETAATLRPDTRTTTEGAVPWHKVHNHSGCGSGQWAVVKDSDGSVTGCHSSE